MKQYWQTSASPISLECSLTEIFLNLFAPKYTFKRSKCTLICYPPNIPFVSVSGESKHRKFRDLLCHCNCTYHFSMLRTDRPWFYPSYNEQWGNMESINYVVICLRYVVSVDQAH